MTRVSPLVNRRRTSLASARVGRRIFDHGFSSASPRLPAVPQRGLAPHDPPLDMTGTSPAQTHPEVATAPPSQHPAASTPSPQVRKSQLARFPASATSAAPGRCEYSLGFQTSSTSATEGAQRDDNVNTRSPGGEERGPLAILVRPALNRQGLFRERERPFLSASFRDVRPYAAACPCLVSRSGSFPFIDKDRVSNLQA